MESWVGIQGNLWVMNSVYLLFYSPSFYPWSPHIAGLVEPCSYCYHYCNGNFCFGSLYQLSSISWVSLSKMGLLQQFFFHSLGHIKVYLKIYSHGLVKPLASIIIVATVIFYLVEIFFSWKTAVSRSKINLFMYFVLHSTGGIKGYHSVHLCCLSDSSSMHHHCRHMISCHFDGCNKKTKATESACQPLTIRNTWHIS